MIRTLFLSGVMLLAVAGASNAGTAKLKDLLSEGFTIVGTTVGSSAVVSNALGQPNSPDELVITLQRAGDIAFCHFYYSATYSNETIPDADCFQPGLVNPAPPAPASSPPPAQGADQSSQLAPSPAPASASVSQ